MPARARSTAQANGGRNVVGIGTVDGDARDSVPGSFVGKDARRRTDRVTGVDSAVWLFSRQKTRAAAARRTD